MAYVRTKQGRLDIISARNLDELPKFDSSHEDHFRKLLDAATRAAIYGAFTFGVDVPVGAATSCNREILSVGYAKDQLLDSPLAHAEQVALGAAHNLGAQPDTIAVTLEPCCSCRKIIRDSEIDTVVFVLPTSVAARKGVIRNKSDQCISLLANHKDLPFNIIRFNDPDLRKIGITLLNFTHRHLPTGETWVDRLGLYRNLPNNYRP